MVKARLWWVVVAFAAGLVVGGSLSPTLLGYAAKNETVLQTANPAVTDAPDQTVTQAGADNAAIAGSELSTPTSFNVTASATYQELPVGFTDEGYPYLGKPDAPITLEEYSDFLCPFCGRHFNQTVPSLIEKYARTGQVKYVFRDMPLVSLHPTAPRGHMAARCLAEQSPALFWAMHDELFKHQQEWSRLPDPAEFLAGMAESVGADLATYQACIAAGRYDRPIEASVTAGQALGFNGTPSFQFIQNTTSQTYTLVGAYPVDTFSQWLDALAAGKAPPQEETPEPAELPFWANSEGLAPDPKRPGFTLAGDPYKGNPKAKLVVVEFADFQCDSCQRHALETQPALDEQFVDTGQIMWVFKLLPLKEHAQAVTAAVAAECAADQGQFWEMHHLLFENLAQWSTAADPDAALLALADRLKLDSDQFAACFNSRQALERVMRDLYDAQGVAKTTPTFVFLYGGRGHLSTGALPADQFVRRLEGLLEQARANE
jgi:protein-disulfide isomerase